MSSANDSKQFGILVIDDDIYFNYRDGSDCYKVLLEHPSKKYAQKNATEQKSLLEYMYARYSVSGGLGGFIVLENCAVAQNLCKVTIEIEEIQLVQIYQFRATVVMLDPCKVHYCFPYEH